MPPTDIHHRSSSNQMRAKDMHPLCCISIDCPGSGGGGGIGDRSPSDRDRMDGDDEQPNVGSEEGTSGVVAVAGVLYKWTNFGKGWRSRWFSLKNGVLSYSKVRVFAEEGEDDVRLIGDSRIGGRGRRKQGKNGVGGAGGVVNLKVSSFRESRSDGRRFYIFSTTKTLHLKSASRKDRAAWIEALLSTRCKYPPKPLNIPISFIQNDASFSTEKLRKRLLDEGLGENLVRDCEQLMLSEISQLKLLYEERLSFLALGQLEEVSIDAETDGIQNSQLLLKNRFSSSGHGKYSEYSTTESSDDVEKQDIDELSEEDESSFFETNECFIDSSISCDPIRSTACSNGSGNHLSNLEVMDSGTNFNNKFTKVERRKRLPTPLEKEKGVSLWSMIKDNVGKDLTRVCLPVYFNEPLSSLQKCFEDLEYSHLLDQAYEHGKKGNSLMRILNVAAFAVSGYASSEGRPCKPFNPLLGETYEADFPEKGVRFFSEKVSHHPMLIACHCEGRGWKFWGDSNLKSKFWGRSIQVDPVGTLTLEFDDGEIFQWCKVTTSIYNLILGKVYCDHHGTMRITGNREYSCTLRFKEQSILDRNPHQVHGIVEDVKGTKAATLMGKWDDSMHCIEGYDASWKFPYVIKYGSMLWRKSDPPVNPTRYNLSSFAITLNELTSDLEEKLPPTDSRRRPDQRHLENGEYEKANAEKLRLEQRQRVSRKLQENGWKPRWFHRESEEDTFRYVGGYWEAREQRRWEDCPSIFGDLSKDTDVSSFKYL